MDPLLLNVLGACLGAPIGIFVCFYWSAKAGLWYSLKASVQIFYMLAAALSLIYVLIYYTSTLIIVE